MSGIAVDVALAGTAAALIRPLAWELLCATDAALKKTNKKKTNKKRRLLVSYLESSNVPQTTVL